MLPQKTTIEINLEPWYLGEGTVKVVVVHQGMQAMEVVGEPAVVAAALSKWMVRGGQTLLEEQIVDHSPTGPLPEYPPRHPLGRPR